MLKMLFRSKSNSAQVAKNRLQLVLQKERVGISEGTLEEMRLQLAEVISKYFAIDPQSLEIEILSKGEGSSLSVSTPVQESQT